MVGARITGLGVALPDKVVTNDDLAATLDTSDEWIVERTGISERRIGGTTNGRGIEAAQRALDAAGCSPADLDLVILATTSPDQLMPAGACVIQDALGATCGAFDLNAACSGFVYSLVAAAGFIELGAGRILIVGSETLSNITDWTDRGTAILFGDGSGAAVVEAVDGPTDILGWHVGSRGDLGHILSCENAGTMKMDGREVFRQAVLAMAASAEASLERAGLSADDVSIVVPHQANIRIIDASLRRLGIPTEKAAVVLDRTGNTSSASIPLALDDALSNNRIAPGDIVLLVGFGAGMTSASALIRWPG